MYGDGTWKHIYIVENTYIENGFITPSSNRVFISNHSSDILSTAVIY